ncbi:MAG: ribosome-associated translation inhibitor RaiA [Chloroflexi bacterium]|nr:ribosome-associated translation inhibitor RaiA [Chloroflexota bacterium]
MELNIVGRNLQVTDAIRNYVEKKIGRLDRYLPTITNAQVEITKQTTKNIADSHTVQMTVFSNRTILRAEERAGDLFAAIDTVLDKMYRQIAHYKGKRYHNRKFAGEPLPVPEYEAQAEAVAEGEEGTGPHIVRRKRFVAEPMSEQEAIEQMELLGHDFFLFFNADTANVHVVYRRKDGNYGVLEPQTQ